MKKKIYSALLLTIFLLQGIPTIVRADEDSSVEIQAPTEEEVEPVEEVLPPADPSVEEDTPEETEIPAEQPEQNEESNKEESIEDETKPEFEKETEDESDDEETVVEEMVQDTEQEEESQEEEIIESTTLKDNGEENSQLSSQKTEAESVATTTVFIRIEGVSTTILEKTAISFSNCSYTEEDGRVHEYNTAPVVYCALLQASSDYDIDINISYGPYGMGIEEIAGEVTDWINSPFWLYTLEDFVGFPNAIDSQVLVGGDSLVFYSSDFTFPSLSTLTIATSTFTQGTTTTLRGHFWNSENYSSVASGTLFMINNTTYTSSASGTLEYIFSTGTYHAYISDPTYVRSEIISFEITTDQTNNSNEENQTVTTTTPTTGGGSGSTTTQTPLQTTLTNIISFLDAQQNQGGSFANSASFSDWVALGYNAWTGSANGREALKTYLLTNPNPVDGPNSTTAYARRAMALMSYGISPYSGTATNYIEKIKQTFDGTQFGTVGLINDDIFALIPLLHAGYSTSDPIVASTTQYILSQQRPNGSFENPDMTGAALQVLSGLTSLPNVTEAIEKAKAYILSIQKENGGFGNEPQASFATPWIMQGLSSNGTDIDTLTKNGKTPVQYLQDKQGADGSIGASTDTLTNRIWASAYALPALLKKSWSSLLYSFPKPSSEPNSDQSAGTETEETTATSTIDMVSPTSTPDIGGGSVEENEQNVTEETSSTTEVTILPTEEVPPVQAITPPVRIQARPISQVAGTKIEEEVESVAPTNTQEQINIASTTVDTVPEAKNGSEKPLQYAFGLTILLGLILGWKFLRTLV